MPVPTNEQMTKLFVLFLTKGPEWSPENSPDYDRLQIEHVEYQLFLRKSGKTILVGPLVDNGDIRGLTVFKVNTAEEVKNLIENDPAVSAKVFNYIIHPWMVENEAINSIL